MVLLQAERLADVGRALDTLAIPYRTRLEGTPPALILSAGDAAAPDCGEALHAVVSDAPRAVACDLLLLRPLHIELLRLLVNRACAGGAERRRSIRSAMGTPVVLRIGGDRREAILAEVSERGCALILPAPLADGLSIELELSAPSADVPRSLQLCGTVLGSRELVTGDGATCDVSVRFEPLGPDDRLALHALTTAHGMTLGADGPSACAGDKRVVLGRNVTREALQLEHDPALRVGDACRVALYDGTGEGPLHVRGCVTESAPERGLRLRLDAVSTELARELERIAARVRDAGSRTGFVIAEVEA